METTARGARLRVLVADRRAVDAGLAIALTVMAQVQVPASASTTVRAALLVTTSSLAWRSRSPLLVTGAVAASVAAMGLSDRPPSVFGEYLAVMLAAFTVAESCSIRPAVSGLLLLLVGIVAHDWRSPEYSGLAGFVSDSAIPVVIWLVGRVVRVQSHRADRAIGLIRSLEAEREVLAEAAAAQERLRLARELHDVVTHSLSVIVIQAQGAQRVLGDRPDQAADALSVIETAGRSTLTEMRRLLGLLRADEAHPRVPHPGLDDLAQLAKHVSAAGLPVTLTTQGEPRSLDGGLQLSAYRVVQEALTNSLKHARPATATVTLRWLDDAVEVEVSDTGTRAHNGSSGGSGLVGMRERVAAHGGELVAGPGPDGGFRVSCRLPAAGPR